MWLLAIPLFFLIRAADVGAKDCPDVPCPVALLCDRASCPTVPEATCVPDACTCKAIFTDSVGNVIPEKDCSSGMCPPLERMTTSKDLLFVCSDDRNMGSVCNFTCSPGFHLRGVPYVKCSTARRWLFGTENTKCISAPTCPPLLQRASRDLFTYSCSSRGEPVGDGQVKAGTHCKIGCPYKKILRGASYTTCQSNGKWFPSIGNTGCISPIQTCPSLLTVRTKDRFLYSCYYGRKSLGDRDASVGTVCEIKCPSQMALHGVQKTICENNGKWEPSVRTTQCVRRETTCRSLLPSILFKSLSVRCDYGGRSVISGGAKVGTVCRIQCPYGQVVHGNSATSCTKGGSWRPSIRNTLCVSRAEIRCPSIAYSTQWSKFRVQCTYHGNPVNSGEARVGTVCKIRCLSYHRYYRLAFTAPTSVCSSTGRWTPQITSSTCPY
ncbi:P-selectin-like isoform X2 [Clavelina lepadiformis]|uniref:P-selectin-like isoform X2 n=1 Tax=Clavelina lepadiformis TaxID=159417 RepID=UPI0040412453